MIVQLHVTRRDSERLRYLLVAQRKLLAANKRGVQAELAGGREVIDEAVLLFELMERSAGEAAGAAGRRPGRCRLARALRRRRAL